MGSPRTGHDFATKHTHTIGKKTQNNTKRLDKIVYPTSFNRNCLKMACTHTHTHTYCLIYDIALKKRRTVFSTQ